MVLGVDELGEPSHLALGGVLGVTLQGRGPRVHAVAGALGARAHRVEALLEALREIGKEVRAEPKWNALIRDDIDVFGVEKLADSGLLIRARVKTEPSARWSVGREFNRRIIQGFEARGIKIPRPQPMVMVERAPPKPPEPEPPQGEQRPVPKAAE